MMNLRMEMQIDSQFFLCTCSPSSAYFNRPLFLCSVFRTLFPFAMHGHVRMYYLYDIDVCAFVCQSHSEICASENKIRFDAYTIRFFFATVALLHRKKSGVLIFSLHLFTYLFISRVGYVLSFVALLMLPLTLPPTLPLLSMLLLLLLIRVCVLSIATYLTILASN